MNRPIDPQHEQFPHRVAALRTAARRTAMPWYHNTDAELNPGDMLLPAAERGHQSEWGATSGSKPIYPHYDPHSVYLYNEHGDFYEYDDFGANRYEVEPIGEVRPDPEHESLKQQALEELAEAHDVSLEQAKDLLREDDIGGMHSYVAPRARVIRKVNQKARMMTAAVTVYTKPSCPQCDMTHKLLERLGIEHNTVDVTQDPEAHAYVKGLGYTAAPVVVVNDGESHWSGFRPERLRELSGE